MFLSPLAKRQNSTLKHWQLYHIQLLKWSSWRHFNMELKAPVTDSSSIWRPHICTRPCDPQSHRRVSKREGTRSFCRTFSSYSKASDCNRTTPKKDITQTLFGILYKIL